MSNLHFILSQYYFRSISEETLAQQHGFVLTGEKEK